MTYLHFSRAPGAINDFLWSAHSVICFRFNIFWIKSLLFFSFFLTKMRVWYTFMSQDLVIPQRYWVWHLAQYHNISEGQIYCNMVIVLLLLLTLWKVWLGYMYNPERMNRFVLWEAANISCAPEHIMRDAMLQTGQQWTQVQYEDTTRKMSNGKVKKPSTSLVLTVCI